MTADHRASEVVAAEVAAAVDAPPVAAAASAGWRWVRRVALATYVAGTYVALDAWGKVPSDREFIVGWIVGLLLLACLGRSWSEARIVVRSWAPFLAALFAYDFARSIGYQLGRPVAVTPQIAIDRALGFGRLPTEFLQDHFYDAAHIRWYDVVVSVVYVSHFFVPYATAGYLWRKGQLRWRWYAVTFVAVTFGSCAVYAFWGTAAPWYAAREGLIEPFPRVIASRGWGRVGLHLASRLIEKGQRTVNPFAAIPSLHAAEALLASVFVWKATWKPVRLVLALYPLAMCFTLVYAGEHYLVDVLAGWGCVALALTGGWYLRQRRGLPSPFRTPAHPSARPPAPRSVIGVAETTPITEAP